MSDKSSRIARSSVLKPLAKAVERELRLTKAGESFDQRQTIEHDRDELRRSGILAANWKPNDDHLYWDGWSEQLCKVAGELKAAGSPTIAGQLLIFYREIDQRDEVTCDSRFRFERLAEWMAAVAAEDAEAESSEKT